MWSADSSLLYYRSFVEGSTSDSAIYSVSADGGQRTLIAKSKEFGYAMPWSLSSDGHTVAMVSARSAQDIDLATLDLQQKDSFQLMLKGQRVVSEPAIAPNREWLAYMEGIGAGKSEINIRSFPDVTRQRYPIAAGSSPVFAGDGSELFFFDGGGLSAVSVSYQPTIRIGSAQPLFRGQYWYGVAGPNGQLGRAWDVDRRGQRFLMVRLPTGAISGDSQAAPPPLRLNVVLNWLSEVSARAAAR